MTKKEKYERYSAITLIIMFGLMIIDYLLRCKNNEIVEICMWRADLLNPIIWFLATLMIIFYVASDITEK